MIWLCVDVDVHTFFFKAPEVSIFQLPNVLAIS